MRPEQDSGQEGVRAGYCSLNMRKFVVSTMTVVVCAVAIATNVSLATGNLTLC
jgi:hypothetical protein